MFIMNKIIPLKKYQKSQKNKKMLFLTIIFGAVAGVLLWHFFIENVSTFDVKIPESKNITFNDKEPLGMTTTQMANEFELADNKPILLYIYTTWCKTCAKNFAVFNEIAQEFQNTDLQVIAIAIDRGITPEGLQSYLNSYGNFYFTPRFLSFKEGFVEFLQKKNINYNNRIPFTVLISRDGEIITKFSGTKSKNYLRNKIIKELFL
jgi:thiol-disulfide isomerase/thioredoxin